MKRLRPLLLTLGLLSMSTSAHAIIASVKSLGMAATATAYPLDSVAAAYNPAGLVFVNDRFDLGLTFEHKNQSARIEGNRLPGRNGHYQASRTSNSVAPDFGINKNFCFGKFQVAAGLVAYNRNFVKTTYKKPVPLFGTSKLGAEYLHEIVSPYLAIKIAEKHSIGVSLNFNIQRLKVNGMERFDNPLFSSQPGHVTNRGYSWSSGVGVTFGYLGQFTDRLSVGFAYTPETKMRRAKKYDGFVAEKGAFDIPWRVIGGFSYRLNCKTVVAFDVEHFAWDTIRGLHNPTEPNIFRHKLGQKKGAGFGWRSQTFLRLGVDYTLNQAWTLRAGLRHVRTPVTRHNTAINMLSTETLGSFITIGATWRPTCNDEISMFYAHGFKNRVNGKHSVLAISGGGEVNLSQDKDALGISWGRLF